MCEGLRVKIMEQSRVSAPPHSTSPTSLPLTFLDLPWLFFSPNQPLFFFPFPFSLSHFTTFTLPNLKLSLSLTLQHYFPFAGTFVPSPEPSKPHIVYSEASSVSLVVAESSDDFSHLCGNHARDANRFYSLVPKLKSGKEEIPLMAIQITVFPDSGICIGLAYLHIVADGRTFHNFMNTWAAYCSSQASSFPPKSLPFYDRSVIVDSHGLEEVFLKQWRRKKTSFIDETKVKSSSSSLSDLVRATFLMDPTQMEKIKRFIVSLCRDKSQPEHLSPYVLTCAFLWVCLLKTHQLTDNDEDVHYKDPAYFGFIAGGMTRLQFPVPANYLGNCVGFGRASAMREELLGEGGIVVAARAIGGTIKKLDHGMLVGAEKWVSYWEVMNGSELHVVATWSPKLKLYETDFGWGRPRKIEEISIDKSRAISLINSREVDGGIEIGLALPHKKMDSFTMFFNQGLNAVS
ncbi:anthocyanin 5-aromatic acyltransferase-like [Neltuma alba]|uniref:anthocyanin 5-aromatic acyltransferase-like n=1 Tax=Neltuma alba TaxID=207710 RepID=UPI0010A3A362|nr:anthocyanin 5-aromatic acyltransferase-like [Prosopis alba]